MTKFHGHISVQILFLLFIRIFRCKSIHYSRWLLIPIKISINDSCFFCLITPVENLQNISTNKLIISVKSYHYWIFGAVLYANFINILQSCYSLCVLNVNIIFLVNLIKFKISTINVATAISWSIINNNSFVISVVLKENWVQVLLYSKIGIIIKTRSNYTHRKLSFYCWKFKFGL